ncbi:NAD-dependent protein deacylase [Tritrichomonas foetus]|uniref:NAD-dependent protein deacylase n=1 Tax=Tritrichomonas foetus TaxID=1144522 RepID=A0A1J4JN54_9EUKA|nr:NAD-dependent protein deacylase [Tritrichomonas foetus]|eukprot:OHT00122.1 NAD-dependent protein deacylase [Tritrichomonas foetus]
MGSFISAESIELNINDSEIGYRTEVSNTVSCLIDLIRRFKGNVTVITGAGISSHQLPTFRSNDKTGLWEAFSPPILDKSNFYSNPTPCWRLLANLRNLQVNKTLHPSLTHHVLHYLLQKGFVNAIITQNIDSLHSFKNDEKKVIELHGVVSDQAECETCQKKMVFDNLKILQTNECPRCPKCNAVLKPGVAFFGDAIDENQRLKALESLRLTNVVLLVGTHCTVDPVLSFATEAKRNGAIIVEINKTRTSASSFVDVSLIDEADNVFREVGQALIPDVDFATLDVEKWDTTRF